MLRRGLLIGVALVAAAAAPAAAQRLDSHFLNTQEEYFVAAGPYESGVQSVVLARMLRPASDTTRGEAQFLAIGPGANRQAGQRFWSRHYWRSQIAAQTDMTVGKVVFCIDLADNDGAYRPPASRQEAMENPWWMGTITDIEDLYKQQLKVGEYTVNINCLRVEQAGK